jgi:hypothetical protein
MGYATHSSINKEKKLEFDGPKKVREISYFGEECVIWNFSNNE